MGSETAIKILAAANDGQGNFSVSGTTVTFTGTTCTPAGGSDPTPTLTFTTPNAASIDLNGTLTNAASSSIPGGGAISYASGTPGAATVSSTTGAITPVGTGTSIITATQAASSGQNAQGTQTYTLTVNAALVASQAVASTTLTQNSATGLPFTPVTGSGGTGSLTYALYDAANSATATLPTGLSFNTSTGQITGTPTAAASATTYTVRVTDTATVPKTVTTTFSLTVNAAASAPTIVAAFSPTSITTAQSSGLTLTLTNPNGGTQLTGVAVAASALPNNLNGASPATTCAGGTPSFSGGALGLSGATLNGGASCTVTLVVSSPTPGNYSYTTGAVSASGPSALTGTNAFTPTPLTVNAPAPTVTSIAPSSGSTAGGTPVTITGTGFTGTTGVTIGGAAATGVTVVSATSITATTPAGGAGTASVVVTTPAGSNAANSLYTYVTPAPTVTSIAPSSGPTAGGTVTSITGTNFVSGHSYSASFGGTPATSVAYTDPTHIAATSPAGTGAATVTVTDTTTSTAATGSTTFTYTAPAPTVASIAPNTGPTAGGTPVTITGSNFVSGHTYTASFGGSSVTATYASATTLTATTPAGSGAATVTVTDTTTSTAATGSTTFTYKATTTVVLKSPTLSAVFGVPVTLTASVVGTSPTGRITFKEGTSALRTVRLSGATATFTIASLSVGHHVFVAAYSGDANNVAATSQVLAISVTARPNPALNPDVVGLVTAEVSTATRFGQTQINNTFHRLEELHDEDDGADGPKTDPDGPAPASGRTGMAQPATAETGPTNDASPAPFGGAPANVYGNLDTGTLGNGVLGNGTMGNGADRPLPYTDLPTTIRPDSQTQAASAFQALSGQAIPATFTALNKRGDLPFHLWFAGAVDFGSLTGDGSIGNRYAYSNSFTTSGLTFGADRRFFDGLKAGVAIGVGFDHTDVGTDGTKSDARSYNATLYASYRFLPHTYVDAIAGYGRLGFTLNRWSTDGNVMLNGTREGSDAFGSLVLTHDAKWGAWRVSPYSRLDVVRVDLDAYNEVGSDIWALHYNELETPTISAVVGTRIGYTIPVSWGTLTPMVRMEYSHALTGTYNQTLSYADIPGTNYLISGLPVANNLVTGGVAMRATSTTGFGAELEYLLSGSSGQFSGREVRVSAKQAF